MSTAAQLRQAGVYVPAYVPDHEVWPPAGLTATPEAIAVRVVELLRGKKSVAPVVDSDPWLTRKQAELYLNVSRTMFFKLRREHPEALKPCCKHPLRWSRNALDVFKLSRGVTLQPRRGRRPNLERVAA